MNPEENIELKDFTTFKIGGPARYFFRVKNVEEAREALFFAREKNLPFFILGGGSNLLVSDSGFSGVIVKNEFVGRTFDEAEGGTVLAKVAAGESWDDFVSECVGRGLCGLENLSGIPGTVGAAPVQNIGAYGSEVKDSVVSVEVLDSVTGEVKNFSPAECGFAYRDSFFKTPEGKRFVITSVTFALKNNAPLKCEYKDLKNYFAKKNQAPSLETLREAVLEIRKGKFPDLKTVGTAGSFFKNPIISESHFAELKKKFPDLPGFPIHADRRGTNADNRGKNSSNVNGHMSMVKIPLAWILDSVLGMKGVMLSGAGLHEAQPLVVVNLSNARASDVLSLAEEVAAKVREHTGIQIEWEVEHLA